MAGKPYWVTAVLHKTCGPVSNHITLRGGDREVDLSAFLNEVQPIALFAEMTDMLRQLK